MVDCIRSLDGAVSAPPWPALARPPAATSSGRTARWIPLGRPRPALGLRSASTRTDRSTPRCVIPEPTIPDEVVIRTYAGTSTTLIYSRVNNAAFARTRNRVGGPAVNLPSGVASVVRSDGLILAFGDSPRERPGRLLGFHWTKEVHRSRDWARCTCWASIRRRSAAVSARY